MTLAQPTIAQPVLLGRYVKKLTHKRLDHWTIITSNWSQKEIAEEVDTRIASRIIRSGSKVIELNTTDYWAR